MAGKGLQSIPFRIPDTWDAAWYAAHLRDVLALADTRNALEGSGIIISGKSDGPATISTSEDLTNILLQRFVLASPSGFLTHERVLAGETGVIEITDGGDNADITVSIAVNGINLGKLKELSTMGILGNPINAPGAVQNINPGADGVALAVIASELQFTLTPVWLGDHTWGDGFKVVLGTGGDLSIYHDGADAFLDNLTGDLNVATAASLKVSTDTVERIEIDVDGAWLLAGDAGGAGDVITSAGPGSPVVWAAGGGGGGGGTANLEVNTHPLSPDDIDDEFEYGVALDTSGARRASAVPWVSAHTAGTFTENVGQGVWALHCAAASSVRNIELPITGTFTVRARVMPIFSGADCYLDFYVGEPGGKFVGFGLDTDGGGSTRYHYFRWSGYGTAVAFPVATPLTAGWHGWGDWYYLEWEYDGTNIIARRSPTGLEGTFVVVSSETAASFLGGAPDKIGLQYLQSNTNANLLVVDWVRRFA